MVLQQLDPIESLTAQSLTAALDYYSPFRSFFHLNANAICVIDSNANIVRLNPGAEALLGAVGARVGQSFIGSFARERHQELNALLSTVIKGSTQRIELDLDCFDGIRRHYRVNIIPAWDAQQGVIGAFCVLIDLTNKNQLLKAIAASEAKYRMIADNMTDLVGLMDAHGIIKYASPSHLNVLGYDAEQLIGNTFADYLHTDDAEQVKQQFVKMVQCGEKIKIECRIKSSAGKWLWLETHGGVTESFDSKSKQYLLVSRDVTERKMLEQKLSFMAFHDSLTQLPNRRLFTDRLTYALLEHKRSSLSLAVIYMDLDKFKLINDSLGHDIGDELLIALADRVKAELRDIDTMARFGGDEFVILLPDLHSAADAILIAERILTSLRQPWQLSGRTLNTTSSMGVALYPQHGLTAAELIKQADLALYQAKDNGRNAYTLVSEVSEKIICQLRAE